MKEKSILYHNSLTDFLIEPKYRIYRHIMLIILLAVIVLFNSVLDYKEDSVLIYRNSVEQQNQIIIIRSLELLLAYLAAVYLNIYVLIPRFLLPKKYWLYLLFFSFIILFLLFVEFTPEIFAYKTSTHNLSRNSIRMIIVQFIAMIFMYTICISGLSMPVLFRHWITSGKYMRELEKTTLQNELKYLKNQINPNFLFNILDKSVILTKKDPEHASEILMKLSKLLRYQLYDSTREKVLLTAEITFLKNFLELEKNRRNGNGFLFSVSTEGIINQLLIPPLLLTPFVEYAISLINNDEQESFIHLSFHIENCQLHFTCIGTKSEISNEKNDLSDIKRRLELLFPHSHSLELTQNNSTHCIKLYLNL